MDLSLLSTNTVIAFLLILIRISGMMLSAPLFNMQGIPAQAKIGMAVTFAFLLFPLHSAKLVLPTDLIQFTVLGIQEIALGILLGFAANLVFVSLQMAGEFISVQMGLSISSVLSPVTQTPVPTLGTFLLYFGLLIFLTLNIHHGLLMGLSRSFDWVPLGGFVAHPGQLAERFVMLTSEMIALALMIGVPVMGILLISEVALGFMAKVMPQMNIFMVSMPLKVGLGLVALMISLPYIGELLGNEYADLVRRMLGLFKNV